MFEAKHPSRRTFVVVIFAMPSVQKGQCFPIFISTTKRKQLRGNNRNKHIPKRKCGDVRRKPHQRQETPVSPINTTPQPNPAQKNGHTPSPSQAEIPNPQNPPFPHPPPVTFPLPSQHPSPTQTAPAQLPAAAQHQTRGLFHQPPPTTDTHQPTPTQQLPPLSLRAPQSRRQRTPGRRPHAKCDPSCRVVCTSRKRANEMSAGHLLSFGPW